MKMVVFFFKYDKNSIRYVQSKIYLWDKVDQIMPWMSF